MNATVIGGAGFIGSHVVDHLIDAGYDVLVIDHQIQPHRDDVRYVDVDITNLEALRRALEGSEYIYHLAAVSNVNHAFKNPVAAVNINTLGTVNVLEAARCQKAKRVFIASTVWVYTGSKDETVDEDSPFYMPGAGHIYTSTKIASELFCHDYANLYNQPITILRYGIPYGPRMRDELVIPIFLKKALKGEPITIMGDGSQYRNFIYVDDLARAHILAINDIAVNQTYNLEGLRPITVKETAETIDRVLGGVKIEYAPARPGDFYGKIVSASKAKSELGWEPKIDFEEGMRRTIEWYMDNFSRNQ